MAPPPPPPLPVAQQHNPHVLEANGRYGRKTESPSIILLLNVVNTVTQLLIGAVAFSAFSMANLYGNSNSLSIHIYLCVTGYIILMSQAILSMNSHAGWATSLKYPHKRIIHGIMQTFGALLAIAGSIVRIIDLDEHFNTAHAVLGIVAMILTFFSLIGGLLNFIIPLQTSSFLYKTLHSCIGSLTISVAFICLCLGFTNHYRYIFGDNNANVSLSLSVFALTGILLSSFTRIVKRVINGD